MHPLGNECQINIKSNQNQKLLFKTVLENADSKMVQLLHNAQKVTVYAAFVSISFIFKRITFYQF